jgi:hypothetical protein
MTIAVAIAQLIPENIDFFSYINSAAALGKKEYIPSTPSRVLFPTRPFRAHIQLGYILIGITRQKLVPLSPQARGFLNSFLSPYGKLSDWTKGRDSAWLSPAVLLSDMIVEGGGPWRRAAGSLCASHSFFGLSVASRERGNCSACP